MQIHVHVHLPPEPSPLPPADLMTDAPAADPDGPACARSFGPVADAQAIGDGKILQGLAALLAQFGLIKPVAVPGVSNAP